jgi:hypothetical protein
VGELTHALRVEVSKETPISLSPRLAEVATKGHLLLDEKDEIRRNGRRLPRLDQRLAESGVPVLLEKREPKLLPPVGAPGVLWVVEAE